MSSTAVRPQLPKPVWHDRFSVRLMQQRPRLSAVTAAEPAVVTYPDAADMEPEEAAGIFAAEEPPDEVGSLT